MCKLKDAILASQILNIDLSKIGIDDFLTGLNIEIEHGLINPMTNVTNDNLITTAKIALARVEWVF